MRKVVFGFFDAATKQEIEAHKRQAYDKFYRDIRATVPPNQLLEFHMEDGWGPLCKFLGKDVPDTAFPFSNKRDAHAEFVKGRWQAMYRKIAWNTMLGLLSFGILVLAVIWIRD
jgi:hypothetical protein